MTCKPRRLPDAPVNQPRITIVLLNYKRPQNIPIILRSIREQTVHARVYLWNNGGGRIDSPLIDRCVDSQRNVGCMARWHLAREATTEYVMSLDDDLCFCRPDALENIVDCLDGQVEPRRIIGIVGARFAADPAYRCRWEYTCRYSDAGGLTHPSRLIELSDGLNPAVSIDIRVVDSDARVDIVKGRLMAFRRQFLDEIELPEEREDDIFLSAALARGRRRFHRIPVALHDACRELPEHGVANWCQPGHMQSRDRALKTCFYKDPGNNHRLTTIRAKPHPAT